MCYFGVCDTSKLEMIWQQPLSFDTLQWASEGPLLFKNEVLFTKTSFGAFPDSLKMFDRKTGLIKWTWANYFPESVEIQGELIKKEEKIFCNTWKSVFCIDALTGRTIWRSSFEKGLGGSQIGIIGDYIYHSRYEDSSRVRTKGYLVRSNIHTGIWDTVYTQDKIDQFEPMAIIPPSLWINKLGDSILVFKISYVDFHPIGANVRFDLVAYNLSRKKVEYRLDSFATGNSTKSSLISNDKCYVLSGFALHCVDLVTGKILWEKRLGQFTHASPFIAEDKLFIKPENSNLYALNPITGSEIWVDKDNGEGCKDMIYHDGLIYYTCGGNAKIYAIEAATGKKIWAEASPNSFKAFYNGNKARSNSNIGDASVVIDSELGYIYAADFYFAICLKLPKK